YAIFFQQGSGPLQAADNVHWLWPLGAAAGVIGLLSLALLVQALRGATVRVNGRRSQGWHYKARVSYAQWLGAFCTAFIATLVVWSIPLGHFQLQGWVGEA